MGPDLGTIELASVDAPTTAEDTPVLVEPFSHARLLSTVERALGGRL